MGYGLIGCYIFSFLVEGIVLWQYASGLFEPKRRPGVRLAMLCFFYVGLFLAAMFLRVKLLNAILYFGANFLFLFVQYRLKWYSILFHTVVLEAIMGACELISYHAIGYYAPAFFTEPDDLHHLILYTVSSKITFLATTYMLIQFYKEYKKDNGQQDKFSLILLFTPMASLVTIITLSVIDSVYNLSPSLNWMVSLSSVFLLLANLIIFEINQHNQRKNAEISEMHLLLQKESSSAEYYKMISRQKESQSILIHDMKNHLQSIAVLCREEKIGKANRYIQQLLQSQSLNTASRLCSHELLNAILCRCQKQCVEQGIDFHADIRSGATEFLADQDLTALFGNLLDNAYEAAVKVPGAYIEASASKRENTSYMVAAVVNSCHGNPFFGRDGSLPTTKPDKQFHGLGLKSVRRVVEKYQGHMKLYYEEGTQTFHAVIMLKCPG
jgi:two-component system sensor histidine kinase AgrC